MRITDIFKNNMEENNTVTKDMSNHGNISAETQFLLLAMSYTEYKIGKVFNDARQPRIMITDTIVFFLLCIG